MESELIEYVRNWKSTEGTKPKNEPVFIELFIEFLQNISDCRDIQFDGDGSYFGYQITITKDQVYRTRSPLAFEISYCKDAISVYAADHEGFWTPEYIKLNRSEDHFNKLSNALYATLMKNFGLNDLTPTKE